MDVAPDDPMAVDPPVRCDSCGRVLNAGELVCAECDRKLAEIGSVSERYPFSPVKTKKLTKVCPCCGVWFSRRRMPTKTWPEKAKWYVPQIERPVCPNCGAVLISRYELTGKQSFLIFLFVIVGGELRYFAFPYWYWIYFAGVAFLASFGIISALRDYKDEACLIAADQAKGCSGNPKSPEKG